MTGQIKTSFTIDDYDDDDDDDDLHRDVMIRIETVVIMSVVMIRIECSISVAIITSRRRLHHVRMHNVTVVYDAFACWLLWLTCVFTSTIHVRQTRSTAKMPS
jgi:hypothetical protein